MAARVAAFTLPIFPSSSNHLHYRGARRGGLAIAVWRDQPGLIQTSVTTCCGPLVVPFGKQVISYTVETTVVEALPQ
jgi:hypothetical protein